LYYEHDDKNKGHYMDCYVSRADVDKLLRLV